MVPKNSPPKGKLVLIPCFLGECSDIDMLPAQVCIWVDRINHFVVENEKSARRFIKAVCPSKIQQTLEISVIDKHNGSFSDTFLQWCLQGQDVGLLSDAGCPGVADPGADVVLAAHRNGICVQPLVGPSSILLALMASGMNGQNFTFHGYLPIDKALRTKAIKTLENTSRQLQQTQIFIETPYRNKSIFETLLGTLQNETLLCIAVDITLPEERIKTMTVAQWRAKTIDLDKRPCVFLVHSRA